MSHRHLGMMYIFPGQGSQYVGMGSDIYEEFATARAVYRRASEVVGFDVAELSFQGPQEQLDKTEFTQVALLTHSIACLEVFKELTGNQWPPAVVAGHSLGEYSALVAAESMIFDDALRLVRERGRLMAEYGRGNMVAFRLDLESIKSLADSHYCGIGGCNLPDQTVVCGFKDDLDALREDVVNRYGKAKAGRYLNTEGAFHTYLMISAAEHFRTYLKSTTVHKPCVNVLSNFTGDYHSFDPANIKAALFFQIFHPVKWMWGLQKAIADGVNTIIEFGGGIGEGRSGVVQSPASRKPNLESITRKSQRATGKDGLYLPGINSASLRHAAKSLHALQDSVTAPQDNTWVNEVHVDEKLFRLYVPVRDEIISGKALDLIIWLGDMGLNPIVQTIGEPHDDNIQNLKTFFKPDITEAESYLEVIVGGATGAFLHYRGDEISHELRELRETLEHRGYDFAADSPPRGCVAQ